jgi:hypothetical protein
MASDNKDKTEKPEAGRSEKAQAFQEGELAKREERQDDARGAAHRPLADKYGRPIPGGHAPTGDARLPHEGRQLPDGRIEGVDEPGATQDEHIELEEDEDQYGQHDGPWRVHHAIRYSEGQGSQPITISHLDARGRANVMRDVPEALRGQLAKLHKEGVISPHYDREPRGRRSASIAPSGSKSKAKE